MKKTELTQMKGLDVKELAGKAGDLKKEIANLVMDKNMKKLKDLKSISKKRKALAQVLTILGQKEQLGKLETETQKEKI